MANDKIKILAIISLFCLVLVNLFTLHYIVSQNSVHHSNDGITTSRLVREQQPRENLTELQKIPRIVHLSWKTDRIPSELIKWIGRWPETNPNWEVWFWTDESVKSFVSKKYPYLLRIYNGYRAPIFKADAMRYIILYEYGGVWADLDIEPLKSLDPIREHYAAILSQESEVHARIGWHMSQMVCNAFMATRRRHPFFGFLIEMLEVNQKDNHPVAATGPVMITRMHKAYEPLYEQLGQGRQWNQVHIANTSTMFLPTVDILALDNLRKRCVDGSVGASNKYLCHKYLDLSFVNGPKEDSYTDHHWWHSWFGKQKRGRTIGIKSVIPNVVFPDVAGKF